MLDLTINIEGHTDLDLESALEEVKRLVSEGFLSGSNSNSTGSFVFNINGSAVDHYKLRRNGKLLKKKFTNYDDALHDPSVKISDDIIMFDEVGYELGCRVGLGRPGDEVPRRRESTALPNPST